jgi:hypothetical protein
MTYKGYFIKPSKVSPNLYVVSTEGRGGKIPDSLTGQFTSRGIAMMEIDKYLEKKVKEDAKTTS